MKITKVPKIIITRPKLTVQHKCPKCGTQEIKGLPIVTVECSNCHYHHTSEVDIDIMTANFKKIFQNLVRYNEINLVGPRDDSNVCTSEDAFKPKSKNECYVYYGLLAIKDIFTGLGNFEVPDKIEETYDNEYQTTCKECGTCESCVTCQKCTLKYKPKIESGKKVFQCPSCHSRSYYPTPVKNGSCSCESEHIRHTTFPSNLKACPRCNSTKINKPKKLAVYKLVIKHLPKYYRENGNEA